jgi:hypothetical protein
MILINKLAYFATRLSFFVARALSNVTTSSFLVTR